MKLSIAIAATLAFAANHLVEAAETGLRQRQLATPPPYTPTSNAIFCQNPDQSASTCTTPKNSATGTADEYCRIYVNRDSKDPCTLRCKRENEVFYNTKQMEKFSIVYPAYRDLTVCDKARTCTNFDLYKAAIDNTCPI
ncbi:hypothetical protein ACHAXT_012787 [Thalassiosira profunda]